MGTPANTAAATTPTKKISRFRLPRSCEARAGAGPCPPTSTPHQATAPSTRRQLPTSARRSTADRIMKPMPTGSAAARQTFGISSAGVVMKLSSEANSKAGSMTRSRKARAAHDGDDVEEGPHRGRDLADEGRHPHVLATLERHDGPQHGEPEEQHRGQLVRPDDRLVKDVAGDDAGEQDADLGDDQRAPPEPRPRDRSTASRDAAQFRFWSARTSLSTSTAGTFSGWVMAPTPACRRLARGCSRPPRRTSPSSRGRSSSCAGPPGTAPGRRR